MLKNDSIRRIASILIGFWNNIRGNNLELSDQRLSVCVSCDLLGYDNMWYCKSCECSLELKTKVRNESCPEGKWI